MRMYDALILGGGCSGLSLAMSMAASPHIVGRFAILEPRSKYLDDRTWSFWDVHPHAHEDLISRRWRRWQVSIPDRSTTSTDCSYHYCQIRSGDFYEKALRRIGASGHFDFFGNTTALDLRQTSNGWEVMTNSGNFHAPLIFDGRPPAPTRNHPPSMLQHFLGWRVEFNDDVLDPQVARLMDFRLDGGQQIHFMYVLPESSRTALVESTFFGPAPFAPETYETLLGTYLGELSGGENYRIIGREQGIIPMNPHIATAEERDGVVDIGTRASCIKPSSGYGFLNIQRHTQAIIAQWEAGEPMKTPAARKHWISGLDRIFLKWLRANPAKAPRMFYDLFRQVPPDSLVRFLSEQPGIADVLQVAWAMPRGEFLAAALLGQSEKATS